MKRGIALFAVLALIFSACDSQDAISPQLEGTPTLEQGLSKKGKGGGADTTPWEFGENHVVEGIPGDLEAQVAALGGSVLRSHPEINIAIVTGLSDEAADELASSQGVRGVTRDIIAQFIPELDDPSTEAMSEGATPAGHDPTTAFFFPTHQWDMRIIDADDAWNAGFDDASGVRVAILDSGIDPFHQDLVGLVDAGSSIAFVPSLNGGGPPWGDDNFHGTHVAGTVSSNGIGTSGVAPHTTLIAVKVCNVVGSCPFSAIIGGIIHAANVGADVINMSLGGSFPKSLPGGGPLNAALNKAINYASRNGVLVVSSAGNAAADLQHNGNVLATPCENGTGICVSATGPTDALASYSNFGVSAIDVAAPCGDFNGNLAASTVLAPCSTLSLLIPVCSANGFYLFLQGTSMSAPHVSGTAALVDAQSGGGLNGNQLEAILQQSADDLGKKGTDPAYGHGRINVFNAVQ